MLRLLCRLLVLPFVRWRVLGAAPARPPEKLIVIANHQSFVDAILLGLALPWDLTWIVHTTIAAQWHFHQFLKFVPHLVVDVTSPLAMKAVAQIIEQGKPVVIFPEGRITVTGSLMKVYDGVAFLALRTGAQLLPVWIEGALHSKATRHKPPFPQMWRAPVTLTFFPVEGLPAPVARTGRERRRLASNHIRRRLEEMSVAAQPATTVFEEFLRAVDLYGRKRPLLTDIRFEEESYGKVLRGALALGRLTARHAPEGERVGVLMPNASPTAMLLLGLIAMRRVPAMLNYSAGVDGMRTACEAAMLRVVFTSRAFLEKGKLTAKLEQLVAQLPQLRVIYLEDLRPQFTLADKLWLLLYAVRAPRSVMRPAQPDDPAVVLFTSGSEGKPKGVVLSHRNLLANVAQARAMVEFSFKDKFLIALPLFHSFGLTAMVIALLSGARVFLYPSPLHYRLVPEMAYDMECTVLFGTPTFLANYARFAHTYDFFATRYVVAGAEKLTDAVRQTWIDRFGIRIMEGYGVTECAPLIAVNAPYFYRHGSVGRIVPGLETRLEAVEGIPDGGILHVKGPNVMLGYLRAEAPGKLEPPSSIYGPGWYSTGDVAGFDEEGSLHLLARLKRFAKVAGEMVSLEVAEQIALAASPKRAHAATALSDSRRGEVIVLFTEDRELRREQLVAAARELGLPEVAIARTIVAIDKLPRLGSGKVDYLSLKTLAQERTA